jgi:hypothetical protein
MLFMEYWRADLLLQCGLIAVGRCALGDLDGASFEFLKRAASSEVTRPLSVQTDSVRVGFDRS